MVPSDSGNFPEYREVTGTSRGKIWALWAIGGRLTSPQGAGAPPTSEEAELDLGRGRHPRFLLLLPLLPPFHLHKMEKRGGGQILLGVES